MENRISMITLGVENLKKSIDFYENGLSLHRRESPPEVAFFDLKGAWLGLYGVKDLAKDADVDWRGEGFRKFTISHNVNSQCEVDALISEAVENGATLVKKAVAAEWGGYSGYFADPDGHLWEVAYNPEFWVGPKS